MIKEAESHIHRGRDELLRGFGAAVGHRRIALSRDGRKPRRLRIHGVIGISGAARASSTLPLRAACSRYC